MLVSSFECVLLSWGHRFLTVNNPFQELISTAVSVVLLLTSILVPVLLFLKCKKRPHHSQDANVSGAETTDRKGESKKNK